MRVLLFLLFFPGALVSCRQSLSVDEMELYLQDKSNGLLIEKEENNVKAQMVYRPSSMMVLQELSDMENVSDKVRDSIRKKYDSHLYFILNLSENNEDFLNKYAGTPEFSSMIGQFSFGMGEYLQLVSSSRDTIPLQSSMYSRMYGMSGTSSVLLVFDYKSWKDKEWIDVVLKDSGLGIGTKKFRFRCSDLMNLPELKENKI